MSVTATATRAAAERTGAPTIAPENPGISGGPAMLLDKPPKGLGLKVVEVEIRIKDSARTK